MSIDTLLQDKKLYKYILNHSLRLKNTQQEMFEKAKNDELAIMNTAPEQVQFLNLLIKLLNAKTVIEIGVFRGFGTLGMSLALPEDGILYACDVTDEYLQDYKHYWQKLKVDHKIQLKIAPAAETLDQLIQQNITSVDFAYIDADKESYAIYYEKMLKLLKPGGVIVFDNMLWSGAVADEGNQETSTIKIRELNDIIHQDNRVEASLLPIGDGINIVRKK